MTMYSSHVHIEYLFVALDECRGAFDSGVAACIPFPPIPPTISHVSGARGQDLVGVGYPVFRSSLDLYFTLL
jgi:hypothetical protein